MALSGGGHRAAAWGLGVVYALLSARAAQAGTTNDRAPGLTVSSIASVSGGSITNGVLANRFVDVNAVSPNEFVAGCRDALHNFAYAGLIFFARHTNPYVFGFLGALGVALGGTLGAVWLVLGAGRDWPGWLAVAALAAPLGLLVVRLVVRRVRDDKPGPAVKWLPLFLVGALIVGGIAAGGVVAARAVHGDAATKSAIAGVVVAALFVWLVLRVWSRRGEVVEHELARVHFHSDDGTPTRLADLADRKVHHVVCATELQFGEHFYMSPKLVYGYGFGDREPTSLTVARAVQASSAVPLLFPPQETALADVAKLLPNAGIDAGTEPPSRVVLVDGGVYDNMADEWALGFADRAKASPLVAASECEAGFLVVANAGKRLGRKTLKATNALARELRGVQRDQQIQYDTTTAQRRRALVARFRAGEADRQGVIGVIAHIATTPYDIVNAFVESPDPGRVERARAWHGWLRNGTRSEASWKELADRNAAVPTVLHGLGKPTTLDLLEHAVTLTLVALSVIHDIGTVAMAPTVSELDALFFPSVAL